MSISHPDHMVEEQRSEKASISQSAVPLHASFPRSSMHVPVFVSRSSMHFNTSTSQTFNWLSLFCSSLFLYCTCASPKQLLSRKGRRKPCVSQLCCSVPVLRDVELQPQSTACSYGKTWIWSCARFPAVLSLFSLPGAGRAVYPEDSIASVFKHELHACFRPVCCRLGRHVVPFLSHLCLHSCLLSGRE